MHHNAKPIENNRRRRQRGRTGRRAEFAAIVRCPIRWRGSIVAVAMAENERIIRGQPASRMRGRKPCDQGLQDEHRDRDRNDRAPQFSQGCNEFAHDILSPESLA
jgi:hypothetical protein